MSTLYTRQHIRRGLALLGMIAVVAPLSLKAGQYFVDRKMKASRQFQFEESRRQMEEQRDYMRVGGLFPDFALLDVQDSTTTTLHDMLRDGGMMVYISPECPSCDEILATIRNGLEEGALTRQICFVADATTEEMREWRERHGLNLRCFIDRDRFIGSAYDYTIIPFAVMINARFEIVDFSTGGWADSDYARMLTTD